MQKVVRRTGKVILALLVIYLLLLIPDGNNDHIVKATEKPFLWNRDDLWQSLEHNFDTARSMNRPKLDSTVKILEAMAEKDFAAINTKALLQPSDSNFTIIENNFFATAALVAAQKSDNIWFLDYYNRVRNAVKWQSQHWNMADKQVRNRIYSMLYGMRAAVEEVLLQADSVKFTPALLVKAEPSATPSAYIFGIEVHSGDLLVSRGGAEVSALISRGNDYPGNFSHVALVYVDAKTHIPYLIEAHIEKGVAVSSVDQYENDKKLRFMVLRPREDLPQLLKDTMLPQKAAKYGYDEAFSRHIPYDFKMDYFDSSAMFCSEVGSYAYRKNGIQLWQGVSTISSQGIVNLLHAFGVENFVTQMPSDLEYDPQLSIVAEWRQPTTLFKDHIDNAVIDAMLEQADKGETVSYNIWQLPLVRLVKAYCIIKNKFGKVGMIPEGMSATQALKNQNFVAKFAAVRKAMLPQIDDFISKNGYRPPYWQLVKMAKNNKPLNQ